MKKRASFWTALLLFAIMLAVCCVCANAEDDADYKGDVYTYYIDKVYSEQINRYYVPLSERWEKGRYSENGLSVLPYSHYEGDPLDHVGFGFVDLDHDGNLELVIGAIPEAEKNPSVFEIWTLVNDVPVMLAQGGTGSHYVLLYEEENDAWYVVSEVSNGAESHATHYLRLEDGEFKVVQGIVFDAAADERNPWFMTYDLDWDVANDEPIDEETASAILESYRNLYAVPEYFPYFFCE